MNLLILGLVADHAHMVTVKQADIMSHKPVKSLKATDKSLKFVCETMGSL